MNNSHSTLAVKLWLAFFCLFSFLCAANAQDSTGDTIIIGDSEMRVFNFVGGGDLNSIAQGDDQMTAGNISVGLYMLREFQQTRFIRDIEIDFAINVSTTTDEFSFDNPRSFGNYILNPINTRQSARLDFYSLFKPAYQKDDPSKEKLQSILIDGGFMRFYGSNSTWNNDGQFVSATALHFKVGIFHDFLPDDIGRSTNSSVMLGLAYGLRAITGDIRANDRQILQDIINTSKGTYWGLDVVFGVKFNNIRAEFIIPFVGKGGETSVPGLTDTQFITQIRFVGGFPLAIDRNQNISNDNTSP